MELIEKISNRIVQTNQSIIHAMKKMDIEKIKLLFIFENNRFKGLLTIGDIQRAILKDVDLSLPIITIFNSSKIYAKDTDTLDCIKRKMMDLRAECMPVLDKNGRLVNVFFWEELFSKNEKNPRRNIRLPVIIMAGGKGTRLAPLTNIYPKPLIPIGEKTIIESIMDKFVEYDCHNFYISVNYKAEIIKNYFNIINNPEYCITYFQEDKPMGTAGSLRLLKNQIKETFFVSNCDILIDEDYADILDYHRNNKNELTVVAAVKTLTIPYGTIITGENGILESIEEKPTFSFKINTGLYILEPTLLNDIPDEFFHITHLMEKLKGEGRRVGVYPIRQNDLPEKLFEYSKIINIVT